MLWRKQLMMQLGFLDSLIEFDMNVITEEINRCDRLARSFYRLGNNADPENLAEIESEEDYYRSEHKKAKCDLHSLVVLRKDLKAIIENFKKREG